MIAKEKKIPSTQKYAGDYKTKSVRFFIPGHPQPWRAPTRVGRFPAPNPKTKKWQEIARYTAAKHAPITLFTGPVMMNVTFIMPKPKSVKRNNPVTRSSFDRSNMLKALEDAFNKMFYRDDSQIVTGNTTKRYGAVPGVEVEIIYLEDI